ncbi:hypothetical protein F5877DRAFT_70538 [Lentinula edodes]|nr:hypothetical protein F5877DRAFT_70538 [Lentinula edodes]
MFIAHTQNSVTAQTAHLAFTLSKRNLRLLELLLQFQERKEQAFSFVHGLIKDIPPPYRPNDSKIWWTSRSEKYYEDFEDGLVKRLKVATKRVKRLSNEERVPTSFSNPEHAWNPSNHCLPVLETITIPNSSDIILVMRWMQPVLSIARFRTIGESLQIMKEMPQSYMYPGGYLPTNAEKKYGWSGRARHYSPTRFPPRYLLVDFGFSRIYVSSSVSPLEETTHPISEGKIPGVEVINPFPADVFLLGATIRVHILDTILQSNQT